MSVEAQIRRACEAKGIDPQPFLDVVRRHLTDSEIRVEALLRAALDIASQHDETENDRAVVGLLERALSELHGFGVAQEDIATGHEGWVALGSQPVQAAA